MKIGETLRVVDKKLQVKNYLLGKSFLIAVYCCIRATLYPNSRIIVASGTKNQAKLIISQKIDKELRLKYPNIAREIKEIKAGTNECVVYFYNGSTIEAVTSTDNARGYRCNILILDEFRMISKEMLNKVLRPFLNVVRQPKFFQNPKYEHYPKEENKEIYLSSAWYVSHYAYEKFVAFRNAMCKGGSYFCCDFPYGLALEHGLLTKERVQAMKEEEDMDSISWSMEMEGLFFGENESAFFKTGEINPTRTIIKPFYPPTDFEYLSNKDKVKKSNKQQGEIRLIGYDVALMSGSENDNSIYTLMRLLPNGDEYSRQVVYIENCNGSHSKLQAIRLKQLFYDFEADYIAMDTNGNGMAVYDELCQVNYDENRDEEYPAFIAYNNDNMAERALNKNALPVIYSIKPNATVNHEISMDLRSSFQGKKLRLLINELEGREFLIEKLGLLKKTPEEQANLLKPYMQTTALVNETVNLEYRIQGGLVKVEEVGSKRKDRYTSLGYTNYLAKILEKEIITKKKKKKKAICCFW